MFTDRTDAGRALARRVGPDLTGADAIVLALPRGGLPVAAEVAAALGAPLDVMLVRKVGVPDWPELAVAAVAGPTGESLVVNPSVAASAGLSPEAIDELAAVQRAEIRRRRALWLGDRAPPDLRGRTAVLVDDGVATGATMLAAVRAARAMGAARVVVAVPVVAPDAMDRLTDEADAVVTLLEPKDFRAVGAHYARFPQLDDDDVRRILDARSDGPRGDAGQAR